MGVKDGAVVITAGKGRRDRLGDVTLMCKACEVLVDKTYTSSVTGSTGYLTDGDACKGQLGRGLRRQADSERRVPHSG